MNTAVDLDEELLLSVLEELSLPCEGRQHRRGIIGHEPDQPGEFFIQNPCGESCVQCAGRVSYMYLHSFDIGCLTCKKSHPITEYRIIPLRSTK